MTFRSQKVQKLECSNFGAYQQTSNQGSKSNHKWTSFESQRTFLAVETFGKRHYKLLFLLERKALAAAGTEPKVACLLSPSKGELGGPRVGDSSGELRSTASCGRPQAKLLNLLVSCQK